MFFPTSIFVTRFQSFVLFLDFLENIFVLPSFLVFADIDLNMDF